jgi:predicted GH43/DUF377 family glycosyl hydrolase
MYRLLALFAVAPTFLLSIVLLGIACGDDTPATLSTAQLAAAKFTRVQGPAAKGSVLDVGPRGSWCDHGVWGPTVVFDGKQYRMWFAGFTRTTDHSVPYRTPECIGMAISRDGLHWEMANDGQPVFEPGPPGSFDAKSVSHPFVLRVGDEYWMWYGAIDGRFARDIGFPAVGGVRVERIGLAKSKDGIHWNRLPRPVLDNGPAGSMDSIQATGMHVIRKNNEFWMWYGPYDGRHGIALATSSDGVRWTRHNNGRPIEGLVGDAQFAPSVYFDGKQFFMLYNHDWHGSWAMYAAISNDGIHWQPLKDVQPLLGDPPQGNFDTAGSGRNHSVHPSQIIFDGKRALVWYGGEDAMSPHYQRIGLAVAELPAK